MIGSPQALLVQDDLFGPSTDTVLVADHGESPPNGPVVLTDTDRLQEVAFGRVVANRTATLTRVDPFRIDRPVHDYVTAGGDRWKTVAELVGARQISASSSASDVTEARIEPSRQPWSAFDGDRTTRWVAGSSADTAWLEVELDEPTSVAGLDVRLSKGQPRRDLRVTTDSGSKSTSARPGAVTSLATPVGLTRTVRISGPSTGLEPLAIDEIEIPGVDLSRPLRLPALPASWDAPDDIVLTAEDGPAVCRTVETVTRCAAGRDGLGEDGRTIDRLFALPQDAAYAMGVSVRAQDSRELTDYLSGDVRLRASSTGSSQATAGLLATIDGDPQTGWIAALRDVTPTVTIDFGADREVDELVLRTDPTLAASAPRRARVTTDTGKTFEVRFDADGRGKLPAVTSSRLSVEITAAYVRSSLSFDGTGSGLPLGISEIEVPGRTEAVGQREQSGRPSMRFGSSRRDRRRAVRDLAADQPHCRAVASDHQQHGLRSSWCASSMPVSTASRCEQARPSVPAACDSAVRVRRSPRASRFPRRAKVATRSSCPGSPDRGSDSSPCRRTSIAAGLRRERSRRRSTAGSRAG
ncbi:discoidin domain-containing protein [Aeromicrobium sp. UC242_57]|uniref:discoidin domain-containing protein n=1 Tax=Aeromicrobium sp. UC242_57 TaxID=3374624 RepID=UPI0037BCF431